MQGIKIYWSFNMKFSRRMGLSSAQWLSYVLAVGLAAPPAAYGQLAPAQQQAPTPQQVPAPAQIKPMAPLPLVQSLKVIPLAGNGEMNDLERRVMVPLVVEVLDQNDAPIEGADVVFRFPLNGPGAAFAGNRPSNKVRTNGQGQAAATGWQANDQVGTFDVHVTATYGNQIGETTVSMSNVTRIVDDVKKKRQNNASFWSSRTFKIAAIVGGAALVAGIVLATRGGGGTKPSPTPAPPTITITPGSPTVGGPH